MEVVTNPDYWDCSCKENYIHKKENGNYCPLCDTFEEDGYPDSRVDEIEKLYDEKSDNAVNNPIKENNE